MNDGHEQTDAEQNLYCLECGYNLRGLSGDPRRCPECGHDNPMSELTLPAQAISRALRRMETAPTVCAGASMVVLVVSFFTIWAMLERRFSPEPCIFVSLSIGLLFQIFTASLFRQDCGARPGWGTALLKYHAYAIGGVTPAVTAFFLTGAAAAHPRTRWPCGMLLLVDGIVVFALVWFGIWARRNLKATIDPLQRDAAVRIARETIEDAMRRRG